MPSDTHKVDLIIQFALLVAGEEDEYADRSLGPIHLIKYVYLADLANARRNAGETFTGTKWQFYKFGPWAQSVNERVEPALTSIYAEHRVFESRYEDKDEWVRWSKHDPQLLEEIERKLPSFITHELRRSVHKFLKDTPSLLDYVYKTEPMLSAAPNEILDFSKEAKNRPGENEAAQPLRMDGLSKKKQKKFKERMNSLRENRGSKPRSKPRLIAPPPPRYDEVYQQGVAWLDSQAGPQLSEKQIVVEFADDVWKSSTRKAKDVS